MTTRGCASVRKTRLFRPPSDMKETHGKPKCVLGEMNFEEIVKGETWSHENEVVPRVDCKRRLQHCYKRDPRKGNFRSAKSVAQKCWPPRSFKPSPVKDCNSEKKWSHKIGLQSTTMDCQNRARHSCSFTLPRVPFGRWTRVDWCSNSTGTGMSRTSSYSAEHDGEGPELLWQARPTGSHADQHKAFS